MRVESTEVEGFKPGKSKIHGQGLFALRFFKKGEVLGTFEGIPAKKEGMHVIYLPCDTRDGWDGIVEKEKGCWWRALKITNAFKFINHSSFPNCEAVEQTLVALKDIFPGDEITIHYGEAWD